MRITKQQKNPFTTGSLMLFQRAFLVILLAVVSSSGMAQHNVNPFWHDGEPVIEIQQIFSDERLPNIVVAKDGSVIAVWGWGEVRVRRSENGGETRSEEHTSELQSRGHLVCR